MRAHAHDQGFVAAAPARVYALLADPAAYPGWWPGAEPAGAGVRLPLPTPTTAAPERRRPSRGLFLRLSGPAEGTLEWYLEAFEDGTIVNGLLDVEVGRPGRRADRRLRRMRVAVHAALAGLRRRLA